MASPTLEHLGTFSLGGLWFGIAVEHVQEVLREQVLTRVPKAPPVVAGLMNLRGQIVTTLSLARRLGLTEQVAVGRRMAVVVRSGDATASLIVDEAGEVMAFDRNRLEPVPPHLKSVERDVFRGVYQAADRLLIVIDVDRIVRSAGPDDAPAGARVSGMEKT